MYVAGIVFDTVDEFTNVNLIQYDIGKYALTAFAGCLTSMVFVVSLSWNAKWWELENFQHIVLISYVIGKSIADLTTALWWGL